MFPMDRLAYFHLRQTVIVRVPSRSQVSDLMHLSMVISRWQVIYYGMYSHRLFHLGTLNLSNDCSQLTSSPFMQCRFISIPIIIIRLQRDYFNSFTRLDDSPRNVFQSSMNYNSSHERISLEIHSVRIH